MALDRRGVLRGAGALVALGLFPGASEAAPLAKVKSMGVLRVAVYEDNGPWSWESEGRLRGIDVDIATALARELGVRLDLAHIMADESVEDDLRNAVWKGGLLGFVPADVMLHMPFDRQFSARNDQVAFVAPYYRENFQLACIDGTMDCDAAPMQFRGRKLAVELDSIPDFYLLGTAGGVLTRDLAHFPSGTEAAEAMLAGKADAVLASRAQIEAAIRNSGAGKNVRKRKLPLPGFTTTGWDIGMAVKENSRSLGDALEEIMGRMAASGALQAIFEAYGVSYTPALAT